MNTPNKSIAAISGTLPDWQSSAHEVSRNTIPYIGSVRTTCIVTVVALDACFIIVSDRVAANGHGRYLE